MTKKPSLVERIGAFFSGIFRSKKKDPREVYRRLTREEAAAAGVKHSAKRYVRANVKHVTPTTQTIPENQFRKKVAQHQFGEPVSKKKLTELRKAGIVPYKDAKTESTAKLNSRLAKIRKEIPHIAPRDARLIDDKRTLGYNSFNAEQKKSFRELFKRYEREKVLEALGSPIVKESEVA